MACDITLGRKEPCKDSVGGLKAVYFINYDGDLLNDITVTDNEITALDSAVTCFKYELKGANTFDEANENSRENGTSFYTGTGTFIFKKQDKDTQAEMEILAVGRPQMILEDYNGNFRLAGIENGAECAVNTSTGAAMGDTNGYTVTATTQEKKMAYFVAADLIDDVGGFTVTEGS